MEKFKGLRVPAVLPEDIGLTLFPAPTWQLPTINSVPVDLMAGLWYRHTDKHPYLFLKY